MTQALMNISDVAEASGVPPKTIRYYEEVGLIAPVRAANGYRAFSEADLNRLTFLGRARALGFGLGECRTLLSLWQDDGRSSAEVKSIARAHLAEIDQRISDLRAMQATLSELVASCAGDHRPECPILDTLGAEKEAS